MYTRKLLSANKIAWLDELGVDTFWLEPIGQTPAAASTPQSDKPVNKTADVQDAPKPATKVAPVNETTKKVEAKPKVLIDPKEIFACSSLEQLNSLYQSAAQDVNASFVFGSGVIESPRYMIIGEQPGTEDGALGKPFQGAQGELLQAICNAVNLPEQESCYKTHLIKYRMAGGKEPDAQQVATYLPFLQQEIELLKPHNIIALGSIAAGALLGGRENLKLLRGQMNYYQTAGDNKIPLWISHQPVALLVHGARKEQAWRDFIAIAEFNS